MRTKGIRFLLTENHGPHCKTKKGPFWVNNGSPAEVTGCPLLGEERKSICGVEASGQSG